jgi:hypothetical protein
MGWCKVSLDDMLLREEIAKAIEAIPLGEDNAQLNAVGMRILAAKIARGESSIFESQIDFE